MTDAEKLDAIKNILFPPLVKNEQGMSIDENVVENLDAALYDLRERNADKVCCSTIEKVITKLHKVEHLFK